MAANHLTPTTEQLQLSELKLHLPLIGLTGGIGSGKTAVSNILAQLGAGVIDTDLIAHQITAPGGSAISPLQAYFGADFIDSNGALDRRKMRSLVFQNLEAKKALEAITHPLIKEETIKQANQLAKAGLPYLVFVVPLLIESGTWKGQIDHLIVVDCPEALQIERVMQRSNLSKIEVEGILKAQATRQERLALADTVIENQGKLADLQTAAKQLHQKILGIKKDKLSSS